MPCSKGSDATDSGPVGNCPSVIDDPGIRTAALLVLMSALETADDPKSLVKNVKYYAFTRCGR
jgi:hypothetical protein